MFNKPGFGQPTQPAFGGFASPGSSTTASSPFGQSGFNKPTSTTPGFPTANFGGGSTMFGGGTGAQTGTGMFGNTASPAFGQQAQPSQAGFSGFNTGTAAPLFGTNQGTSGFAQQKPAFGAFNTSTASTGLFGSQPSTVTSGQPSGSSMFNQGGQNLFGTSFGGATGGAATAGTPVKFNPPTGTDSMAKNGLTQTINTRHQCITTMKEYENKSLEELRLEDLQAGRKGPSAGGGEGLFGATGVSQPGQSSLFGTPGMAQSGAGTGFTDGKTMFGTAGTSSNVLGGFGGAGTTFGGGGTSGSSLFGKTQTGFGVTPTSNTTASGFSFNSSATANPFGAAAQPKPFGATPASGLFGAQPASNNMFGAPTTSGFGAFGTQQQQPAQQGVGGLFGQNKAASPFGLPAQQQQQQPVTSTGFGGFGQTANNNNQGGLFAAKPQLGTGLGTSFGTGSVFGAKPAGTGTTPGFGGSTFGAPASGNLGGGLFGQQPFGKPTAQAQPFGFSQQQGGATLGATPQLQGLGTGMFGGSALGKPTGGLFGSSGGTLFGAPNTSAPSTGFGLGNSLQFNQQPTATGGLGLQGGGMLNTFNRPLYSGLGSGLGMGGAPMPVQDDPHKRMLALVAYPYGDRPIFRNLPSDFGKLDELRMKMTSPAAHKAALTESPPFGLTTKSPKLKKSPIPTPVKKNLFEGWDATEKLKIFGGGQRGVLPNPNILRLNLRPRPPHRPSEDSPVSSSEPHYPDADELTRNPLQIAAWLNDVPDISAQERERKEDSEETPKDKDKESRERELESTIADVNPARRLVLDELPCTSNDTIASNTLSVLPEQPGDREEEEEVPPRPPHPAGVVLTRSDYYTIPSLEELAKMTDENGHCIVDNFTVGRERYGNLFFEDSFDVAGLNLDDMVHIRFQEVVVYPDEDKKPPQGEGLNRPAQVTLDRVFPAHKETRQPIKDPEFIAETGFEDSLRRMCQRMKVRFLEYRPDTGSWVFKVEHFSKYGMENAEKNEDEEELKLAQAAKKQRTEELQEKALVAAQQQMIAPPPLPPMLSPVAPQSSHSVLEEPMEEACPEARSPTEQLSRHAGTDSAKVRVMKASLFSLDADMEDDVAELDKPSEREESERLITPLYDTPPPSVGRAPEPEILMMVEEVKPRRPQQHPSLVLPGHEVRPARLPRACNRSLVDASLAKANAFRPSWGPGNTLLSVNGLSVDIETPYVNPASFKAWVQRHLSVQLSHTSTHDDGGEVPLRCTLPGLDSLKGHHEALAGVVDATDEERLVRQVLRLCVALWGDLRTLNEDSPAAYVAHERRRALCEWLEQAICCGEEKTKGLDKVLDLLAKGNVVDGVRTCQDAGDHYSALVLATSGSSTVPRHLVHRQLQEWVDDGVSSLVQEDRLRAWLLAGAGLPLLAREDGETLNALQGLDWISCLAAHFWYLCSPAASIPDVLTRFEEAFTGREAYAAAPIPSSGTQEHLDVRFHLLKLFSQRGYPLEPLLTVETHFPGTPLDYSLGWLLMVLLDSLRYSHLEQHCSQSLHLAFSEQLEAAGMWHWAVFVLQHITLPQLRRSAIEQLILRHVSVDTSGWSSPEELHPREQFLVTQLNVPATLIFQAKAYLAACRAMHPETACFQLHAQDWQSCHDTVVTHLASDAVINEDYALVSRLLQGLLPHSREIDGWERRGKVYLDYLSLLEEVRALQPGNRGRALGNLEALRQQVFSLLNQLTSLPSDSPKDRLCQSEIARRSIALARSLLVASGTSSPGRRLVDVMSNLPLPDDYRLQELHEAARLIMRDL